jgi:hypothetical protein
MLDAFITGWLVELVGWLVGIWALGFLAGWWARRTFKP